MYLLINTSKENCLDVFLISADKAYQLSKKGDFKVSENLLVLIDKILIKHSVKKQHLKGIIAITGPGPFTSVRIAVTVANNLAYALDIPVIGLKNLKQSSDQDLIKQAFKKIKKAKRGEIIKPFYNKEANITQAKK